MTRPRIHILYEHGSNQRPFGSAYIRLLRPLSHPQLQSAFEVTTAMGQLEVVKAGGGIGALHDFMAFGQPGLVRLFPELVAQRTYWTVWHENMRAARRVAAVASFLDDIVREARAAFLPARPR